MMMKMPNRDSASCFRGERETFDSQPFTVGSNERGLIPGFGPLSEARFLPSRYKSTLTV